MSNGPVRVLCIVVALLTVVSLVPHLERTGVTFATEHRNPPHLPNHNGHGKPCPPHTDCPAPLALRVISIIPKDYPQADELRKFGHAMVESKWMEDVAKVFDFPGKTESHVLMVDDMPDVNKKKTVTRSDFEQFIRDTMHAHHLGKTPNRHTFYILYIPCDPDHKPQAGLDDTGCKSHHPKLTVKDNDDLFVNGDGMPVVLGYDPNTKASSFDVKIATVAASHEFVEAATDTAPGITFNLHTNMPDAPYIDTGNNAGGSPWVRESGTIEISDMSEGTRWFEKAADGSGPFEYERIYSNSVNAKGDPAVPRSPNGYFNVTTDENWFLARPGQGVTIPFTAWSSQTMDWDVDAKVSHWRGHKSTPPALAPCALSADHWTVHDGRKVEMYVNIPDPGNGASWCVIRLKSTKNIPNGDEYHEWWVGVLIDPLPSTDSFPCVCPDGFKAGPAARAGTAACEHICRGHDRD